MLKFYTKLPHDHTIILTQCMNSFSIIPEHTATQSVNVDICEWDAIITMSYLFKVRQHRVFQSHVACVPKCPCLSDYLFYLKKKQTYIFLFEVT